MLDAAQAAGILAEAADPDGGVIGFHAQHAVEKSLEAVSASSKVAFPRTHDLGVLIGRLSR